MKIATVLTYYHPHWTGLSTSARSIAEGLVRRGHEVTVLCVRHDRRLPSAETLGGVRVLRLPVVGRFSRGMVAPTFPWAASRLIRGSDVVHVHSPLMEGPLVAGLCRALGTPLVMTHQGDLVMPAGRFDQAVEWAGVRMLALTGRLATTVVAHNDDYVATSPFLRRLAPKPVGIAPPVELPAPDRAAAAAWRESLGLSRARLVGFAGRFVEEKGFDYLLRAVPVLLREEPDAHLVYAGEHRVVYESFFERCQGLLEQHAERVTFVGLLRDRRRMADFYAMCDVFAFPSRTDSHGLVQVEAMLAGTPVVATDIAGGRWVVAATGNGVLVPPRDPAALARGLLEVLNDRERYAPVRAQVEAVFDAERSIERYEEVLSRAARAGRRGC